MSCKNRSAFKKNTFLLFGNAPLDNDNSFTQGYALELIFRSKNQQAIQSFLKSGWTSEEVKNNGERHWGSCLLAEYGQDLPFAEISRRVSIDLLGYAVKKRDFKPEEVAAYGKILYRNMPNGYMPTDVLAEVVASRPKYVNQWMDAELRREKIWRHQGFYESLCEVLLEQQPEQGEQLFWWLDNNNHHRRFDGKTVSFQAADSPEVHSIRRVLLNRIVTDDELFQVVFLAQKHGRHEWLDETITTYLKSDFGLDTAKGLFMLGFMDDSSAGERLDTWIAEKQPSWLHSCAQQAKIIHEHNQWAHHWFKRFVNHRDTLQAWAAFRLFLRCVDRRFWLWGEKIIYSQDVPYERFEHYRACRNFIVKAIKKNEEKAPFELKKCLVGCRVREKQLWPWLEPYSQQKTTH